MFTDLFSSGTPLLAILAVLALVDSLSYGTLAVPVWLLLTPGRIRPGHPLIYLGTIATFYFAVGLVLLLGAVSIADGVQAILASDLGRIILMVVGVGLVVWSFTLDSPKAKARQAQGGEGRVGRWRRIAMAEDGNGSLGGLIGLALTAGLIELASMLPYLAAIALLTQSGTGMPNSIFVLAGYCAVMIAPALLLLAARIGFGRRLEPLLEQLDAWITKHAGSALAWVVGIVGVVIVVNTAPHVLNL